MNLHRYTYICLHTVVEQKRAYTYYTYKIHMYIFIYMYIYMCIYMYVYMCIYICIYMYISGLALDITLCSPFWRLCDNFKSPKVKSISHIHKSKTFQIDVSHILLKILHFFNVQS